MIPRYRWRLRQSHEPFERVGLPYGKLLTRVLLARGYSTVCDVERFVSKGTIPSDTRLCDSDLAVSIMKAAGKRRDKVLVHGDYDVDGITSTAMMATALTHIGCSTEWFIPDRETGYGLCEHAIADASERGASLLVAVDCGSSDQRAIHFARERGMRTIVLDHHFVPAAYPPADAFVNPRRPDCASAFKHYSASGVCYIVLSELLGDEVREYLDLAALGTVADVMPLVGPNRWLVQAGLEQIDRGCRTGIAALLECARVSRPLLARDIAFVLGPRLNAAGRVGSPEVAYELLMETQPGKAHEFAHELELRNRLRQQMEQQIMKQAETQIEHSGFPFSVIVGSGWNKGLLGLVAGKLSERLARPVAALSLEGRTARASARAPLGFNLYDTLAQARHLLLRFGGHERAAGFDVEEHMVDQLRDELTKLCDGFVPERPLLHIDSEVSIGDLTLETVAELDLLEPCGEANPRPLFLIKADQVLWPERVGAAAQHLKFGICNLERTLDCVWFGAGEMLPHLPRGEADIVVEPHISNYNGRTTLSLHVHDIKQAGRIQVTDSAPRSPLLQPVGALLHPHTADTLCNYLESLGRYVVRLGARQVPTIGSVETDYVLTAPPEMPEQLKSALCCAPPGSRLICCFSSHDISQLLDRLSFWAPDRDTLLGCYRLLCRFEHGASVEDLGAALQAAGTAQDAAAHLLAESAARVFSELALVSECSGRFRVIPYAQKAELMSSGTFAFRSAVRDSLVGFYDSCARDPDLVALWFSADT